MKEQLNSHIGEFLRVGMVNGLALIVSISGIEATIRILIGILTIVYTVIRIIQGINQIKNK